MKRILFAVVLVHLCSAIAAAQGTASISQNPLGGSITATSSACATASSCVWMKLPANVASMSVVISGTFSATLLVEQSGDGVNFTTAATLSAAGTTTYALAGMTDLRVRASSYASGQAQINLQASSAAGPLAAGSNALGTVGITNTAGSTDPCQNPSVIKSSAFANISTATTTALVPVSGATAVYVCGFVLTMVATVAADTILFESGTGAACAGAPVSQTSTFSSGILVNGAVSLAYGGDGTIFKSPASNGICAVTTVGTGPAIAVTITYVQQ